MMENEERKTLENEDGKAMRNEEGKSMGTEEIKALGNEVSRSMGSGSCYLLREEIGTLILSLGRETISLKVRF
jgi:hypothetical protein